MVEQADLASNVRELAAAALALIRQLETQKQEARLRIHILDRASCCNWSCELSVCGGQCNCRDRKDQALRLLHRLHEVRVVAADSVRRA